MTGTADITAQQQSAPPGDALPAAPEPADTTSKPAAQRTPRVPPWVWRVTAYGLLLVTGGFVVAPTSSETTGLAAIGMMLVLLFMKVPIALAMLIPSALALTFIYDWETVSTLLGEAAYEQVASWSLSVVPMFVFMGLMLWRSGITTDLFNAARILFNRVPASLAVTTNMAGGGLAAVSGSTVGTTYALARIGLPEMLRAGYDKRLATSSVLMAGLSGQLIPPSLLLVIYAGVVSVPVGPQLMAGVGPGIALVLLQAIALGLMAVVVPKLVGGKEHAQEQQRRTAQIPLREKARALAAAWPVPLLIFIVIGGMFSGLLTETEAGATGALMALLLAFWKHRKGAFAAIRTAVVETAFTTAAVMFLLMAAGLLTLVMADSGLAEGLATWVADAGFSRVTFVLMMLVIYLLLGMFGETLAAMLLTVPILMPLFPDLGIDPLWFGVFAVLCVELGMITPPVGVLSYIVHGIAKEEEVNLGNEISLKDIFTGVAWLLPISVVLILIMIAFPDLALWLPGNM